MPRAEDWPKERIWKELERLKRRVTAAEEASGMMETTTGSDSGSTFMLTFGYDTASNGARFVSFCNITEQIPLGFEAGQRVPILVDCTLIDIGYVSDNGGLTTDVIVYVNGVADATDTQNVVAQTVTIFTVNQALSTGDEIAVQVDPLVAPQSVTGTCRFQVT